MVSKQEISDLLSQVKDPEIPVLSIDEMGILEDINITDDKIEVRIIPTYLGCPAMEMIRLQIHQVLYSAGIRDFTIRQLNTPAWTTDRISAAARQKMMDYGISPPIDGENIDKLLSESSHIPCPNCGSTATSVKSAFGSTACKALMVCSVCKEPFEYFKCFKAATRDTHFN
jgi:ring-1,2-phenylacetyl-CoA epoxidase subunit PaaD